MILPNGDAYCYGVYRSTHRAASDYLADLAQKYTMATSSLLDVSGHFATEVDTLQYSFIGKGAVYDWLGAYAGHDRWAKTHIRK